MAFFIVFYMLVPIVMVNVVLTVFLDEFFKVCSSA